MNQKTDPRLITYNTLRRAVGYCGILLPALLIVGARFLANCTEVQNSISAYYYTIMGDGFVGILCAIAFFLIVYQGYDSHDNFTTNLGGAFAVGIALFPTSQSCDPACAFISPDVPVGVDVLHYISAALFFLTLAYISFFLFTKSKGDKTEMKKRRNSFYKITGVIIVACLLLILLLHRVDSLSEISSKFKLVFILEWIALIAFGISWLIKGEMFMTDKLTIHKA